MENSLEELDDLLKEVGDKLNKAAYIVRELEFDTDKNVREIGLAFNRILTIQRDIYKAKPELEPEYLKEKNEQ